MNRTVLALSLMLTVLVSAVATNGNVTVTSAVSPVWVEVARFSGGIAIEPPENDTILFAVSHLEWRVRWSIVPLDSGLPIGDGSDFRFVVRPEYAVFEKVGEVSGKIFSETESGTLVVQNSYNRTFYIEIEVCGYTSYELIVEENSNSPLLDIVPPAISVFSPENKTYDLENITVIFAVDKPTSSLWCWFDTYGKLEPVRDENVTVLPEGTYNVTIIGLPEGTHNVTIYARDEAGNTQESETIYFSVESAPATLIAMAAIVMAVLDLGLLFYYFRKRNSKRVDVPDGSQ